MDSLKDSTISDSDFSPLEQFQQVAASILLMQQSFRIKVEKLKTARIDGIINDREYGQWIECLDSLRRDWLEKDFTRPENILLLKFMSMQCYQKAKKLKFSVNRGPALR